MSSSNPSSLPATHRALYLTSTSQPLSIQNLPTPQPTPGSAIVRILAANILSYSGSIYDGSRKYAFPVPMVPGVTAIGRITALGPDATLLEHNDLVHVDCTTRGRDDPTAVMLSGIHEGGTNGSRTLMRGEWRNSTYAEFAKVPLENCTKLDEEKLCGKEGLGYSIEEIAWISTPLVPFGGLKDVNVQVGETVIVAPATGQFGQAAVEVAVAMGAKVIAMGRNETVLADLAQMHHGRVVTVPITGDVQADTTALKAHGPIDVYFDISPPQAAKSTHFKSCIMALSHGARVSMMGGIQESVGIPYAWVMHNNMSLRGKWMYERSDIKALIKMVEKGIFSLRSAEGEKRKVRAFGLEDWKEAFTTAEKAGVHEAVVFVP